MDANERRVFFSCRAARYLARLPVTEQQRIIDALELVAGELWPALGKRLKGCAQRSLRVGTWRVILTSINRVTIRIDKIAPRGGPYTH